MLMSPHRRRPASGYKKSMTYRSHLWACPAENGHSSHERGTVGTIDRVEGDRMKLTKKDRSACVRICGGHGTMAVPAQARLPIKLRNAVVETQMLIDIHQ
jgi:hypothetical protein